MSFRRFFWCILLCACSSGKGPEINYYIDLEELISQEIDRLEQANPSVKKRISLNGELEEKQIDDIDWKSELNLFLQADINKAAYSDLYDADTLFTNKSRNRYSKISYKANSHKLKTQELHFYFLRNTDVVFKIEGRIERINFLYTMQEDFGITLGHSYFVTSTQKVLFLKERDFRLDAEIIRPTM